MSELEYESYLKMTRSDAYTELHRYYTQDTYLDVLGVSRQENPHSSFIRWLFDPKSNHSLGDLPFRRLMEIICLIRDAWYAENSLLLCDPAEHGDEIQTTRNIFHDDNSEYLKALQYGRYEILSLAALTEQQLSNTRRADIFLKLTLSFPNSKDNRSKVSKQFILVIENKVHSQEHTRQTADYAKLLLGRKSPQLSEVEEDALVMMVFLNPYTESDIRKAIRSGKPGRELPSSHQFVTINYQALLDGVLEPCLPYCDDDRSRMRLSEYIRCLGQARTYDDKDNAEYLVMAVSQSEAELALQLYKQSQDTIRIVMDSLQGNEDTDFYLNEAERGFWMALANVYEYLFDKFPPEDETFDKDFRTAVAAVKKQVRKNRKYRYKDKDYESFTSNNIGMLGHDIICDLIKQQPEPLDIEKLRRVLGTSSWLRQTVITEDEVLKLPQEEHYFDKGFKDPIVVGADGKRDYRSQCIQDFTYSFFSYLGAKYTSLSRKDKRAFCAAPIVYDAAVDDDLACVYTAQDGTKKKLYVAKFWTVSDINALIEKIKKAYGISIQLS